MRNSERVLNSLAEHSKISTYRFERLYRILFNQEMYYIAYQRIYSKEGNMTTGVDGKTIDDMSISRIELFHSVWTKVYLKSPKNSPSQQEIFSKLRCWLIEREVTKIYGFE